MVVLQRQNIRDPFNSIKTGVILMKSFDNYYHAESISFSDKNIIILVLVGKKSRIVALLQPRWWRIRSQVSFSIQYLGYHTRYWDVTLVTVQMRNISQKFSRFTFLRRFSVSGARRCASFEVLELLSDIDNRFGSGMDSRQLLCDTLNNKKLVLWRNVMEG